MIRLLLFASVFTTSILLCGSELQTVEGALQSKSIQVTKDGQRVQAELQNVQLTIPFPNGKIGQADIVMLHEPQSGLFWWRYQAIEPGHFASTWAEDFLSSYKVYITEDKIVVFTFSRPFVWVRESSEHCSTLAEGAGERPGHSQEQEQRDPIRHHRVVPWRKRGESIGAEFLNSEGQRISVSRAEDSRNFNEGWRMAHHPRRPK